MKLNKYVPILSEPLNTVQTYSPKEVSKLCSLFNSTYLSICVQHGTSSSKLTMSLVNVSLKFQMAILEKKKTLLFLLKNVRILCSNAKDSHLLQRILTFFQQNPLTSILTTAF